MASFIGKICTPVANKSSPVKGSITIVTVTFFILLLMTPTFARYLPTRSDNSRRERIKEVLRVLLELSNGNENDLRSLDNGLYASNIFTSRDSNPNGPIAFEFTGPEKVSPLASSGLNKRSIGPFNPNNSS